MTAALSILVAWWPQDPAPVWLYALPPAECVTYAEIIPDTICVHEGEFPRRPSLRPVARPENLCRAPCEVIRPQARSEQ